MKNPKIVVRLAACGVAVCGALSLFADHNVSTVAELVDALTKINSGASTDKVVVLAAGTYVLSGTSMTNGAALMITKSNVTLQGADNTSWRMTTDNNTKVVLDAKETGSVVMTGGNPSGIVFRHLTIANGKRDGNGAGIWNGWYGNVISLTNCVLRNNRTGTTGYNQGGGAHQIKPTDCYFVDNYAKSEGGAFCGAGPCVDCVFERNSAGGNGGAIRNSDNLTRCTFIGNTAGGGLVYGSSGTVVDCIFTNNTVGSNGCLRREKDADSMTVKNSQFYNNRCSGSGSYGACVFYPKLVTNCVFVGNIATKGGAAVFALTNTTRIVDCAFTNNVAWVDGGAIYGNSAFQPTVVHCDFYGNVATNAGGAVVNASLSDCTFRNCQGGCGGAASWCSLLTNCTFVGCAANTAGGATYDCQLTDCFVTNCTARGCDAAAGVRATSASYLARKVRFVDCRCETNGHYVVAAAGGRYEDCDFSGCTLRNVTSATRCRIVGNDYMQVESVIGGGSFTNCLVTGLTSHYMFKEAKLVNCSVVSNNLNGSFRQLFAGTTKAWNSILHANYHGRDANGKEVHKDLAGYGNWYLTNCVYKTHPNWSSYTFYSAGTVSVDDPKKLFIQPNNRGYDPENPYALKKNSPARNAGCDIAWPAGATDLIGNPRVFADGANRVDIGCYEYSLPSVGSLLLVR